MKIVRFHPDAVGTQRPRLGVLQEDHVVDLAGALGDLAFRETGAMIAADVLHRIRRGVSEAASFQRLPIDGVRLVAPILPTTILCSGSNYREHNEEKAGAPSSGQEPEFFVKTADCVVGPGEPIVRDARLTEKLDCETELAVVIGRAGRHIPVEHALDHVFGYTVVNDVTARDRQVRRSAEGLVWYDLGRGKVFDSSAPLGPAIVTADEIEDPQSLQVKTRINGELRQSANTSSMIWSCAELIHAFSRNLTLRPGMVIITGTPAGTAWSTDASLGGKWRHQAGLVPASRYCEPGDVVECEIERIGVLMNPIVAGPPPSAGA